MIARGTEATATEAIHWRIVILGRLIQRTGSLMAIALDGAGARR